MVIYISRFVVDLWQGHLEFISGKLGIMRNIFSLHIKAMKIIDMGAGMFTQ